MTRVTRRGWTLVLVAVCLGLVASAWTSTTVAFQRVAPGDGASGPTMQAGRDNRSESLRELPTLRLVTSEQRSIITDARRLFIAIPIRTLAIGADMLRRSSWCDVQQCRRATGADLLRFATPPPL